ncbi:hypothetical protein F4604DRAFT_1913686 [Suillus subluteus]|nr:hypothetical protein F4604DRAFT_1913686 [Suillus subluteus]
MHKHGLLQPSVPTCCLAAASLALLRTPTSQHHGTYIISWSLRARTSRPNYASLAVIGDEEYLETGLPKLSFDEDEDSESDFAPDKLSEDAPEELQNDSENLLEVDEEAPKRGKNQTPTTTAGSRPISHLPLITGARPSRNPPSKSQSAHASTSKMSTPRAAKMYALPNPSVHHRHRDMPVFLRKEKVG